MNNLLGKITGKTAYGAVPEDDEDDSEIDGLLEDSHSMEPHQERRQRYLSEDSDGCSAWWFVAMVMMMMAVMGFGLHYKMDDVSIHEPLRSSSQSINTSLTNAASILTTTPPPVATTKMTPKTPPPTQKPTVPPTAKVTDPPKKVPTAVSQHIDRGVSDLKPITHHLDDMLFECRDLKVDGKLSGLNILNMDITSLRINGDSYIKEANLDQLGPHSFHVRYPKNKGDEYATDEIRKMCFYFELKENANGVNAAQIDLKWNEFKLEPGFDRVLLRHFNETIVYPPESFSGRVPNLESLHRSYSLFAGEHKTICLEFQSDDSVVDQGFDFELNVRYDVCEWTEWDKCFTMNLSGVHWAARGPFSNGKCGVGIMHKHRTMKGMQTSNVEGVVDCTKEHSIGPEFCIKAPCGNYDNAHDSDHPCHSYGLDPKVKCWHAAPGRHNMSRLLNGRGRVDPVYPDPFALYLSENRHRPFGEMHQNIDRLKKEIAAKMKSISDTHDNPNVLRFSVQDPEHKNQTADYMGARVLDSLLIGRPFIVDMTGDSVMSGHDSMFMSTIALQTQSRLREFWVEHGVKGSTFQVRNIAEGGGPSSDRQGPLLAALSTENHDYFSLTAQRIREETAKENTAMIENDDHYRFLSAGIPIYDIDLHGADNTMCDGGASFADREAHIRYTGFLNGIWMRMANANGATKALCEEGNKLIPHMSRWSKNDNRFPFVEYYANTTNMSMGILDTNTQIGMRSVCHLVKEGTEFTSNYFGVRVKKNESGAEPDGELADGKEFGYTSTWLMNNWHPAPRGARLLSDIVSFWMLESAYNFIDQRAGELKVARNYAEFEQYLKRESGEWKTKMMNSIKSGDIQKDTTAPLSEDMFPRPVYCGKPNGQCFSGIPFALTAWQPRAHNTHSKMSDYIMNPGHSGWRKIKGQPSIQALENKEGGPGWADDKASWQCDVNFYSRQFGAFAAANNISGAEFGNLNKEQLDGFHADLIQKELFLQFAVKVPLYGNGTVRLSKFWPTSWVDNVKKGSIGSDQAIVYLAKIDDKTVGEPSSDRDSTAGKISWQGLEPGQKYKLSVVPYKLRKGGGYACAFSNIVAF